MQTSGQPDAVRWVVSPITHDGPGRSTARRSPSMNILAIDTSHHAGSVAASNGTDTVVLPLGEAGAHARHLAAALEEAAGRLGWAMAAVDLVAVVRGPGSFTGLRVGVTTAKAIAWTSGCRLVGVSAFEVVARRADPTAAADRGPIAIAFDAGRGDVFAATVARRVDRPGRWSVAPPQLLPAAVWTRGLPRHGMVSGPGLALCHDELAARPDLACVPPELRHPHAAEAAALARLVIASDPPDDPFTLLPDYARPSYADERTSGG